jgi:hypothetical protein
MMNRRSLDHGVVTRCAMRFTLMPPHMSLSLVQLRGNNAGA